MARRASDSPEPAALAELLRPIRGRLVLAAATQAVAAVLGVVPFVAVAELGRALLAPVPDTHRALLSVTLGVVALLLRLLSLVVASSIAHAAENDFQLDVRRRLVARLERLPLGWFDEHGSGVVKKAVQDDVDQMHHLVAHSLLELVSAVVVPVVSLAYLFRVDWRMSLVTLAPLVLGMALYGATGQAFVRNLAAMDTATARINAAAVDFVRGIAVIKTFGQAGRSYRRFTTAADEFAEFFLSWVARLIGPRAASEVVLSPVSMLVVVLAAGALFVVQGWLPARDVVPFALLGVGLSAPIGTVSFAEQQVRGARAAAARVLGLLSTPELPEPVNPVEPTGTRVEFDRVEFSYDGVHPVLRELNLVLEPGTVTALVGASGAGKSTVAALLARFWDPNAGEIRLGGVDLRRMSSEQLHRRLGLVFQDVRLLRESVSENIRIARPDATDEDVHQAARHAQIHHRIMALRRGYDSVIGEDAVLSGGERQRLSIARALLADVAIVVLDEATAHADPDSEAAVQRALSALTAGRTALVIAHRLQTVMGADQIAVIAEGRVSERGRHGQLLASGGRYARLWRIQHEGAPARPDAVVAGEDGGTR